MLKCSWRDWWKPPALSWWINPSGGDVAPPPPWSLWDRLLESPAITHVLGAIIGALIAWGAFALLPLKGAVYVVSVALSGCWQWSKLDALCPLGRYRWREVVWRMAIGAVPLAILLYFLPFPR